MCESGSTYDFISPLTRLQLLHLLCCERLENAAAMRPVPEEDDSWREVSTTKPSWRQVPIATDQKGRRYFYLGDYASGNACGYLFRSRRLKGKPGEELPPSDDGDADADADDAAESDAGSSSDSDAGEERQLPHAFSSGGVPRRCL